MALSRDYTKLTWLFFGSLAFLVILIMVYPLPQPLFPEDYSTAVYDRNGQLLGARISSDEQWRFPIPDSLPGKYISALLHFEDKRFFDHGGIDVLSIGRAMYENYRAGTIRSGGSTISMQLVRLSTGKNEVSFRRKFGEILGAIKLEHKYNKAEILSMYAAHAPFGGNVVGLEAASWRYFGKAPETLTWAEASLMAVLPNAPSLIHPGRNRMLLLKKRDHLLKRLYDAGYMDAITYELSLLEPLPEQPERLPDLLPHLTQHYLLNSRGQRIKTTLNASLQNHVADFTNRYMQEWSQNYVHNAAVLVLDTRTGEVVSYVGNTGQPGDSKHGRQVDVIQAPRSSGSILKPFLYNSMLHHGHILPASLVDDIPLFFGSYRPVNFNPVYDGVVPADVALIRSLNVPAVNMLNDYGMENFHQDLRDLGFSTITRPPGHYGLSLILGGAENTLWDVCGAYRQLALKLLHHREPWPAKRAIHHKKQENAAILHPVASSAASVYLTFEAMKQVVRPEAMQMWSRFEAGRPVAWKTGTSIGFRDAWAVGVTPDYIVGVWVGNADGTGRPELTGINAAAPLMFDVFRLLPINRVWFDKPHNELESISVCKQSGLLGTARCSEQVQAYIPYNNRQPKECHYHINAWVEKNSGRRVHSGCSEPDMREERSFFVLPPRQAHFYQQQNPGYMPLPRWKDACRNMDMSQQDRAVSMIYPIHDAVVQRTRSLSGDLQPLMLQAAAMDAGLPIYWHLNEQYLGMTSDYHHMEVNPEPGIQLLKLTPVNERPLVIRFTVVERG